MNKALILCSVLVLGCSEETRSSVVKALNAPNGISGDEWAKCDEAWKDVLKEWLGLKYGNKYNVSLIRAKYADAPPAIQEYVRNLTDAQLKADFENLTDLDKTCVYYLLMTYCGTYAIMNRAAPEPLPGWYIHMHGADGVDRDPTRFQESMKNTLEHFCPSIAQDTDRARSVLYMGHVIGRNGQWWRTLGMDENMCPKPKTGT